ncbi:hypothetical protein FNV43_RR00988 [Rhamnella rubrinervis]|uniref:Uncharacterized protein n=1 Tax=Rhamnella rubrinervis TaxID=2594499 RepID=A0A8K0MSJ1_9ROSA|nr:hypothetical protein FNV43_RR00988 [Rhamnella rubrinervis]
MTSKQVKNQVRDNVEQGFNSLHKVADAVTFPLAPLDGAIHGTARGIFNWLLDKHPEDKSHGHNLNNGSQWPQKCHPQPQNYPPQPQYYPPQQHNSYPGQPQPQYYPQQPQYYPPQPQNYFGHPYPGYPSEYPRRQNGNSVGSQNIYGITNETKDNTGEDSGAIKVGNLDEEPGSFTATNGAEPSHNLNYGAPEPVPSPGRVIYEYENSNLQIEQHDIKFQTGYSIGSDIEAVIIKAGDQQKIQRKALEIVLVTMLVTIMKISELAIYALLELLLASHT